MRNLLTKKQVADVLQISIATLDRRRVKKEIREIDMDEGKVKRHGPGRRLIRFEPEEVERYIRSHCD